MSIFFANPVFNMKLGCYRVYLITRIYEEIRFIVLIPGMPIPFMFLKFRLRLFKRRIALSTR